MRFELIEMQEEGKRRHSIACSSPAVVAEDANATRSAKGLENLFLFSVLGPDLVIIVKVPAAVRFSDQCAVMAGAMRPSVQDNAAKRVGDSLRGVAFCSKDGELDNTLGCDSEGVARAKPVAPHHQRKMLRRRFEEAPKVPPRCGPRARARVYSVFDFRPYPELPNR